ncbi:MAG: Crp/Fnr family transcriptional regulator [Betaproteobacteria bacterium]|nr:Crp/Fnr family transcriptional regulator [Betaproteobacteria bacterium]MSQ89173.1 Crp/Fnr family transcriptional regulator [Betaproteobacteria bacterium]
MRQRFPFDARVVQVPFHFHGRGVKDSGGQLGPGAWSASRHSFAYRILSNRERTRCGDRFRYTKRIDRSLRVGEWVDLLSLVENLPAFENCTTSESVTAASFNRVQFDDLFESAPPIARHLLYMLAKQLARTLNAQNKQLSAHRHSVINDLQTILRPE